MSLCSMPGSYEAKFGKEGERRVLLEIHQRPEWGSHGEEDMLITLLLLSQPTCTLACTHRITFFASLLAPKNSINLIAKTVAVYKYAYRTVVLFCNTTGS